MTMAASELNWARALEVLDYAYQPIVNSHTGTCFGYEALLRNVEAAGFRAIGDVFETARADNLLYWLDLQLREKAIAKAANLLKNSTLKLFFNLDGRILNTGEYTRGNSQALLAHYGLRKEALCFEISEKHNIAKVPDIMAILGRYREQGYRIAMDDYGCGYSGLQLLYYAEPDFIKIDRFFIDGIERDTKKKTFVANIIDMAHRMGSMVIAEGVETEREYHQCRALGCDLMQGFWIQAPTLCVDALAHSCRQIAALNRREQRHQSIRDETLLTPEIQYREPLSAERSIFDAFERFRNHRDVPFVPVVNASGEPLGVIREHRLKAYSYSRFGKDLLQNRALQRDLRLDPFIDRVPTAQLNTSAEKILEIYVNNQSIEGLLMVNDYQYVGFLSAESLLRILNEKNLALARTQNPLTQLPGNSLIHEYVSSALADTDQQYQLVYFDFDHFKAYNDHYGFRSGDRVIQLFADRLKRYTHRSGEFAGHLGGDDFFLGIHGRSLASVEKAIRELTRGFAEDVLAFYDAEARAQGYLEGIDRDGARTRFPLLSASAVIMHLPPRRPRLLTTETLSRMMADAKKQAKRHHGKLVVKHLI